jgi:hypothetical protein
MIAANSKVADEPDSPSAFTCFALPVLMRLASSLAFSADAKTESTLLVSNLSFDEVNHQMIYATPIIILGS